MPTKYIDQSAQDLSYNLILSPFLISKNFKIVRRKEFTRPFGRLVIAIIGESHAIQIKGKYINLTEILAYSKRNSLSGISKKQIDVKGFKKMRAYKYKNKFFRYSFSIRKDIVGYKKINSLLANLNNDKDYEQLFFKWRSSFTLLKYRLSGRNLIKIRSLHFYRNESILIKTASDIRLNQKYL